MGIGLKKVTGILVGVLALGSVAVPVFGDEWDLSEDGKYWQYYGYQDEPLKDEWIEDKGKTYYLDSMGNMKTGWVTNQNDGKRYYMGEDGAMLKNAFTPDGRYVGPDGVIVERYDTYRKKVKAEINKAGKPRKNSQKTSVGAEEKIMQPYFLLTDLNQDSYKDLVVMYAYEPEMADVGQGGAVQAGPVSGNLVEIVVWNPEEENFQLAAEFDETGEGEYSTLYIDLNGGGIWLEIMENEESVRLFQMEVDTSRFKGEQSFSVDLDDWGGAEYFIDGSAEEKAAWDEELKRARLRRGNLPLTGYLQVSDKNIKNEVDRELSEGELYLWE